MESETVLFNGIKFRRYPSSKRRSDRVYYRPHSGHIRAGVQHLHAEIWKNRFGSIPAGHHIHHKDGNPLNNDIANLEAIDGNKHLSLHNKGKTSPAKKAHLKRIRVLASEWHRSREGRRWHHQHAIDIFKKRKPIPATCCVCGKTFDNWSHGKKVRFCGGACHQKDWRTTHPGYYRRFQRSR